MLTARKETTLVDQYLSLNQAAKELSEGRQRILQRLISGELEGSRVASRTVVTRASVERLKAEKTEQQDAGSAE